MWATSKRARRRRFIRDMRVLHKTNHRLAYQLYLASPYWQEKRELCFAHYFHRCALCGSPHSLQAHHTSYRHLFDELLCELVCLCADCHAKWAPKSAGLYKG